MKTRCPCCGATLSLDVLVANESTRDALQALFKLAAPLGPALLRYLSLHRPRKQDLSMARVGKLLGEIVPDIQAQRISRDGQVFDAPLDAWIWAIDQAVVARDEGRLKTPLKGHGWLYEVISSWRPAPGQVHTDSTTVMTSTGGKPSKTMSGIAALEAMKNG